MLEILLSNLGLIFVLILMLAGTSLANILFGLYANVELKNESFDWGKLLHGIKKLGVVTLGTACLMTVFVLLPGVLEMWDVQIDPTIIEGISAVVIVAVYVFAIASVGAEAVAKLREILKVNNAGE